MTNDKYLRELAARGDGSLDEWFYAEHAEGGKAASNLRWMVDEHRDVLVKALAELGLWCSKPPYPCLHRDGGRGCETCRGEDVPVRIAEWLAAEHVEGGPTNGIGDETNGTAGGITLPDGDAMDMLRKWIAGHDPHLRGHGLSSLKAIADMVERDYVRRGDYDFTVEMLNCMKAERDEAIEAYDKHIESHDAWHEAEDIEYTRNRFSMLEKAKNERIAKLESERDEWKAKAEHYGDHVDRLMEAIRDLAQKQPWTFDPEAPYKNAELVGKYIDELESRSEGSSKVRVGSSSAKRAAAVERLRNCFYTSDSDLMRAMLNWGHEPHTGDDSRFALIDLLTDEPMDAQPDGNGTCPDCNETCPNDDYTPETVVNTDDVDSNDGKSTSNPRQPDGMDSREKLEEDIEKRAVHAETILGPLRIGTVKVGTNVIHGWLDRQAEITKREWAHVHDAYIADVRGERDAAEARAAELEAEIAKRDKGIARLKRQRDEARADLEAFAGMPSTLAPSEHERAVDRLQRENIELARDLAECSREREVYRDACGRLLDLADEMRLVRLDGCGAALVDERGEVVS